MNSIKKAVKFFGGNAKMAKATGIRADYIYKMACGKRLPSVERAIAIEKATKGHVTAEEIIEEKFRVIFKMKSNK